MLSARPFVRPNYQIVLLIPVAIIDITLINTAYLTFWSEFSSEVYVLCLQLDESGGWYSGVWKSAEEQCRD